MGFSVCEGQLLMYFFLFDVYLFVYIFLKTV